MYYNKDEVKNSLTTEQICSILVELDAHPLSASFGLIAMTVCHNGPGMGSHKLYYYEKSQLFYCYTECGSMDVFEVVARAKTLTSGVEWNLYMAIDFIVNLLSLSVVSSQKTDDSEDFLILKNLSSVTQIREKIDLKWELYDEAILNRLIFAAPGSWLREGITVETMMRYGIKFYPVDCKIVIPHYNIHNQLIGIRGRTVVFEDEQRYGKYMPLKIGDTLYAHPLSYNLYGLNLNLKNINTAKKIIIFEGEKSVMMYDSLFGMENNISVATCGSSVSMIHQEILKQYGDIEEVIIAYDKEFIKIGDVDYQRNTAMLTKIAERLKPFFAVSFLFDTKGLLELKDSPIDKGKSTFEYLIKNRIFI